MPKKFQGENSKAAEAKARKDLVQSEARAAKEKEEEDKLWEDNNKNVLKKQERKEDKEKKQQEAAQKKLERDRLLEEEDKALSGIKSAPAKVTRAHIDTEAERERQRILKEKAEKSLLEKRIVAEAESPLVENVNRHTMDGSSARNVQDALNLLSVDDNGTNVEKHPERRAKAAYLVFEEREMVRLKEEYPNFRLSQLKQMLKKEWQKSPQNPFNNPTEKYNAKPAVKMDQNEE